MEWLEPPPSGQAMTPEEYARLQYLYPDHKYEYIGGRAYAQAGGSREHSAICVNIQSELRAHFKAGSGPCFVANSDLAVQVGSQVYLPDATVSCDLADRKRGVKIIRSPHIVVEVLSPSTEDRDKSVKLEAYKACLTIEEIVFVNQFTREVVIHSRDDEGQWDMTIYRGNDTVLLRSLDIALHMDDIYYGVEFDEPLEE